MHRQLDNDLSSTEEEELLNHLADCPTCQKEFEELKLLHQQLADLPKVMPPHSIVDSLLPELEKQNEGEAKLLNYPSFTRKPRVKKRFWMPGLALVAGLFIVLIFLNEGEHSLEDSSFSSGAPELASLQSTAESVEPGEGSIPFIEQDTVTGDVDPNETITFSLVPPEEDISEEELAREISPAIPEKELTTEEGREDALEADELEEAPIGITDFTVEEEEKYPSPDGMFTAYLGLHHEEIFIDKEEEAYYMTKHSWKAPWLVEEMTWIDNETLYYVLHHPELDEYQYWLIHVPERKEEQLEEAYKN